MSITTEKGPVVEIALDAAAMVSLALLLGWSVAIAEQTLEGTAANVVSLTLMAASIVAFVVILRDVVRQIRRITDEIMKRP